MTANDSSTGGYLAPVNATLADDDALEDQLQALVVGVTGLGGTMVRPRWQATMPEHPEPGSNWCAIGYTQATPEYTPSLVHSGAGNGSTELQAHEVLEIVASFYGPNSGKYAGVFRDGLQIAQNREALGANGMVIYDIGGCVRAPLLVNNNWLNRWDVSFRARRQVNRVYAVRNILSVEGTVTALVGSDVTESDFIVEP